MNAQRRRLLLSSMILFPVLLISGLLIMSLFSRRPDDLGLQEGQLQPCPGSPNCVCSYESPDDTEHFISPLTVPPEVEQPMEKLAAIVTSFPRTNILKRTDHYLHVEFTTAWLRFVDDVEFHYRPDESVIHFRSASRLGHSDLGANRNRAEKIRQQWQSAVNQ